MHTAENQGCVPVKFQSSSTSAPGANSLDFSVFVEDKKFPLEAEVDEYDEDGNLSTFSSDYSHPFSR